MKNKIIASKPLEVKGINDNEIELKTGGFSTLKVPRDIFVLNEDVSNGDAIVLSANMEGLNSRYQRLEQLIN